MKNNYSLLSSRKIILCNVNNSEKQIVTVQQIMKNKGQRDWGNISTKKNFKNNALVVPVLL